MRIVTLPSLSDVSMMTTRVAMGASDSPISVVGKNRSDSLLDLFLQLCFLSLLLQELLPIV